VLLPAASQPVLVWKRRGGLECCMRFAVVEKGIKGWSEEGGRGSAAWLSLFGLKPREK